MSAAADTHHRRAAAATYALLATTVAGSGTLVVVAHTGSRGVVVALVATTVAALAALAHREARRPLLASRHLVAAALVLCAVAVVRPPSGSTDMWSYAMYGRMVAHYGLNPYTRVPAELLGDPVLGQIAPGWWGAATVYGPAFTALSAALSALAGSSLLATRLLFQTLAAGSVLGIAALLVRARLPRWVLAATLLNPILYIYVVNQGHNDGLVALGLALAAVLLTRRRVVVAGLLVAAAASVKIVALLAAGGAVVWLWRRARRADAVRFVVAAVTPLVASYAVVGGPAALRPLLRSDRFVSRASPWGLLEIAIGRPGSLALVAVAVIAVVFASFVVDDALPAGALLAGVAAFLLGGAYVLPWYLAWALPLAALTRRARPVVIGLVVSAAMLLAYQYMSALGPHGANEVARQGMIATQVAALGAIVVTLFALPGAVRHLLTPPVSAPDGENVVAPGRQVDEQTLAAQLGG